MKFEDVLEKKIIIPGGAGLVGQNLVARLVEKGFKNLVVLDKHARNVEILKSQHPGVIVENVDLADNLTANVEVKRRAYTRHNWSRSYVGVNTLNPFHFQLAKT